jgi:hypothetical protein
LTESANSSIVNGFFANFLQIDNEFLQEWIINVPEVFGEPLVVVPVVFEQANLDGEEMLDIPVVEVTSTSVSSKKTLPVEDDDEQYLPSDELDDEERPWPNTKSGEMVGTTTRWCRIWLPRRESFRFLP